MGFDKRGTELLGKSAEILRKHYDFMQTPPELLAYVGHKFTFIVKVLYKSIEASRPSFEVVLIKEKFVKEAVFPKSELYQELALFAWLISHQPAVLFSQSKPATSNQPAVLFSQNKPAPAISHQPNELDPAQVHLQHIKI
jgi:hypothetical protein